MATKEFELQLTKVTEENREEIIDEMALPFLELAERFEAARLNGISADDWSALMDANAYVWMFFKNYLPQTFDNEVSEQTTTTLESISQYMMRARSAMHAELDVELAGKIVQLNLNMCDQILRMRVGSIPNYVPPMNQAFAAAA
ncbi:hypothetical protein [Aestuariispira ectoiniformans]|uniref:hypothetical protein n=1 Tax=Aestuariispira ectoiniformans TaxID=2775080 RepID=UPI00223AC593|nr:hypothetical protein [Aestuariispira ectoiniformans]